MHVTHALLAIAAILLASSEVLADATDGQTWGYSTRGRALRTTNAGTADASSALTTTEERAFFSNIIAKMKVRWWLETGKSEKDVMKALKLDTLSGAALTSNKNYKYFQKFVTTAEFNKLNKWLTQDTSTFQAWKNLGLHKLDADQLKNSPALATYKRYVKMYDDDVILQLGAYKVPSMNSVGSPEEMAVKTRIWAQSNRKVDYVKKVLSLEGLSDSAMEAHKNYKYFKQFMDARKSSS